MMTQLERRVRAIEDVAGPRYREAREREEVRLFDALLAEDPDLRRAVETMADEAGMTVEALAAEAASLAVLIADVGKDRMEERCAAELGIAVDEYRGDVERSTARFSATLARG